MKIRIAVVVALAMLAPLATGRAQISNPLKFTLFGGGAIPRGDSQDLVKSGYTVGGALDLKAPLMPIGLRGEVLYSSFDAKGLGATGKADVTDFGVNLNGVAWIPLPTAGLIRPYLTAGPSWSRLEVSPTGVIDRSTSSRWGFNAGGGVQFSLGELGVRFDARYRRISTDGKPFTYVPLTVGIVF